MGADGEFVEDNKSGVSSVLKTSKEIITAEDFITKVYEDITIYNAVNTATYGRAAGYYDEEAEEIFKEIGTTRNNYNSTVELDDVMDKKMGEGSDIKVNSVSLEEQTSENSDGETVVTYEYVENGPSVKSDDAMKFIDAVRNKITAADVTESTLNSADSLKVADTIAKEQRSSLFYAV